MRLVVCSLLATCLAAQVAQRDLKLESAKKAVPSSGRSWAVVAGISRYKYLPPRGQLRYAHKDAEEFAKFLATPAGGSFPPSQIRLLTNENATLASLRAYLGTWLVEAAAPEDTVYVFFAGHGVTEGREAYLVAHDTDPQNLYATALSVQEFDDLVLRRLKTRRTVLFADACHSGYLGWSEKAGDRAPQLNKVFSEAVNARSTLSVLASRADERSYESEQWGGGHGAFSFHLLEGLRGKAELQPDRFVTAGELIAWISETLPKATNSLQHPQIAGHFDPSLTLSSLGRIVGPLPPPAPSPESTEGGRRILSLVNGGKVLEPGGAWDIYVRLKPEEQKTLRPVMLQALEEIGQSSINDYVQSTAGGLKRASLLRSAAAFERLKQMSPHDPRLEAKRLFCLGRARILEGLALEAVPLLEKSIQLDPKTACPYNALGAALEKLGRAEQAMAYFQKAAELAPDWALPRFQLAGQHKERNDPASEIVELQRAADLNPNLLLARWRLGNVQRMTKNLRDAEAVLLRLIDSNPNYAPAYFELGLTYQAAGDAMRAAEAFDAYLQLAPNFADSAQAKALAAQSRKQAAPRPSQPKKPPSLKR